MKKLLGILLFLIGFSVSGQMPDYNYTNVVTNGTLLIKSGAGFLHCITINGIGTSWSLTLIDNIIASGTKIATVTPLGLQGQICYDVNFMVGLTIVTTGVLPGDLTVSWR